VTLRLGQRKANLSARVAFVVRTVQLLFKGRLLVVKLRGRSMEPTYFPNELVLFERLQRIGDVGIGDVVLLASLAHSHLNVKRIAALPGADPRSGPHEALPPGTCFVVGDNSRVSADSRQWGPLPLDAIAARAIVPRHPMPPS
jgi:signal peptidase I